jgi:HEAT repeat protein
MGLFDLFKKKDAAEPGDKELGRLRKMFANKLSQSPDREEALERLVAMGSPEASEVLLTRFSWNLDPSITDQEEKARVIDGLVAAGQAALPAIRAYCAKSESVVWPIKALRRIVSGPELERELLLLLDEFDTEYTRNPEPKLQLIQALEEFPTEDTRVAVEPFLSDVNEQVRFAAASTVFSCRQEAATEGLVVALIEDESLRVRNRIAAGLSETGWLVPTSLRDPCRAALPPGFTLDESGRITGTAR